MEFGDFGGLPELKADLFIDWGWDIVDGATEPTIELRNLRIDVGSLITDFLKPIVETINDVLDPFRPVVDALTEEIAGLILFWTTPPCSV